MQQCYSISIVLSLAQAMCHYGCPSILITDQGRELVNELSTQLYTITQTEHRITSAYHPQVHCISYIHDSVNN